MKHLTKTIDNDFNAWIKFKEKNKINEFCIVSFQNGELIEVDTNNKKVLDWAKTKGLT